VAGVGVAAAVVPVVFGQMSMVNRQVASMVTVIRAAPRLRTVPRPAVVVGAPPPPPDDDPFLATFAATF